MNKKAEVLEFDDFIEKKSYCNKILLNQFLPAVRALLDKMTLTGVRVASIAEGISSEKYVANIMLYISSYYLPNDEDLEDAIEKDTAVFKKVLAKVGSVDKVDIDTSTGVLELELSVALVRGTTDNAEAANNIPTNDEFDEKQPKEKAASFENNNVQDAVSTFEGQ